MILDPTDQNIRDQGFNFVPFDRFLAAPFRPSNISFDVNTGAGIPTVLPRRTMPTGGEGIGPGVNLGPDARGYLGDFETFDFNERYSNPTIPTAQRDYDIYGNKLEEFTPQGPFSRALGFVKDKAAPIFGGIASVATGIPFIGPALEGFESRFANRQLGAPVIDEFGNVYDEEELNKMNALGGYYTEAARSARRRQARIENMLERQRLGKKISAKNLAELQAQEKAQEAARQAAFEAAMASGQGFYDSLRGGKGASVSRASREQAGPGFDDVSESGTFMDGGIVDLVDIYD
jgi:hypothetical protein